MDVVSAINQMLLKDLSPYKSFNNFYYHIVDGEHRFGLNAGKN